MTKAEKLEFEACQYADVPCLPEAMEKGDDRVWVYAIAKALSYNMSTIYLIVKNNVTGSPIIVKTFGEGACARIDSIHPYRFLEDRFLPSNRDLKFLKDFVSKMYDVPRAKVNALSQEKIMNLVIHLGIQSQIDKDREDKEFEETAKRNMEQRRAMSGEE